MRIIAGLMLCTAVSVFGQAADTNNVTGQWDFDAGDLRATVGAPLQFRGDTAAVASFEEAAINGQRARVLRLPELTAEQGLILTHGAAPNGGGTNVNQYAVIMDVMWPAESDGRWRALLQSDTNNLQDPILFVSSGNGLGVNNNYEGSIQANTWYRIAAVYDISQTNATLTKFVNGSPVAQESQVLGENARDGRFSLAPTALLFTSGFAESAPMLINSIQFRSTASTNEIAALGAPTAGGISGGGGLPLEDVRIEHIQKIGAEIVLTVSGGGTLQVQKAPSLVNANWQDTGSAAATNVFRLPATEPSAFFRMRRL